MSEKKHEQSSRVVTETPDARITAFKLTQEAVTGLGTDGARLDTASPPKPGSSGKQTG